MQDKFSDRGFGQGINKFFQEGGDRWMGIIANFSEEGNALGGMSIIMVGDITREP